MSEPDYKPIDGFPGYRVGSDGTVWSEWEKRRCKVGRGFEYVQSGVWRQMSLCINNGGYRYVGLYRDRKRGTQRYMTVHRLVAEAFLGPRPHRMQCRHLDGIRENNTPSNLKWGTARENQRDRFTHGTDVRGERNGRAKITASDVTEIRRRYIKGCGPRRSGNSRELAAEFGICRAMVLQIVRGESWKHVAVN